MTSQQQKSAQSADRDIPDTEVLVVPAPAPVFVDATGRRRRLLRRLSYAFGGVCMLYGGLVSVTLAGGPVSTGAILPLPDLGGAAAAGVRPSPTPQPPLRSPKARAIIEALPRRELAAGATDRFLATHPVSTPSPRTTGKPTTPKPSATTTRTVEATKTPKPSPTPSAAGTPTPSAGPSTPTRQPPPVPPGTGSDGSPVEESGGSAGDSEPPAGGGATALPAPPTGTPATQTAEATPAPSPQPAAAEAPA